MCVISDRIRCVTGIHVVYDISRAKGDRVVELLARCNNCRLPVYQPVQPKVYLSDKSRYIQCLSSRIHFKHCNWSFRKSTMWPCLAFWPAVVTATLSLKAISLNIHWLVKYIRLKNLTSLWGQNLMFYTLWTGMLDADTIISYMGRISPITIGVERRIRFVNETYSSPCSRALGDDMTVPPSGTRTSGVSTSSTVPTVTMAVLALLAWLMTTN